MCKIHWECKWQGCEMNTSLFKVALHFELFSLTVQQIWRISTKKQKKKLPTITVLSNAKVEHSCTCAFTLPYVAYGADYLSREALKIGSRAAQLPPHRDCKSQYMGANHTTQMHTTLSYKYQSHVALSLCSYLCQPFHASHLLSSFAVFVLLDTTDKARQHSTQ